MATRRVEVKVDGGFLRVGDVGYPLRDITSTQAIPRPSRRLRPLRSLISRARIGDADYPLAGMTGTRKISAPRRRLRRIGTFIGCAASVVIVEVVKAAFKDASSSLIWDIVLAIVAARLAVLGLGLALDWRRPCDLVIEVAGTEVPVVTSRDKHQIYDLRFQVARAIAAPDDPTTHFTQVVTGYGHRPPLGGTPHDVNAGTPLTGQNAG